MTHAGFLSPFRPLGALERARHLAEYRVHLRQSDGEVAFEARQLTLREPRMRAIEAWSPRAGDASRADTGILARRGEWLLAATKANEGEAYGVEIELGRFARRGGFPGFESPDLMLRVLMQESYHCRMLAQLCRTAGVEFRSSLPAWPTRAFVAVIGAVPAELRWAIVLAGECVGASLFRRLHDALPECGFAAKEERRLRELIREIWLDEVLHVAFLRASLSRAGLLISRGLLPLIAFGVFQQVPDLAALGCSARAILGDLRAGIPIPRELGWLRPDAPSDELAALSPAVP
ncbi:MAG: hypothetical protein ACHQ6V_01750 [Myxococcota bacterium]|jgi:hypothetical protein